MKRLSLMLFATLMLACARLPQIRPGDPVAARNTSADCAAIFPRGSWQFVHAVQFFPPDGSIQTLMGVVRLSSEEKRFYCAMMTIEGLVLFEAEYDGAVTVQRAVAPLDKPGVAEGMVEDIRLIFFAPEQHCLEAGHVTARTRACRYPQADGGRQDILLASDGSWKIQRYNAHNRLVRTVALPDGQGPRSQGPAGQVELEAHGPVGYRLVMRLIEAIPMEHEGKP